MTRELMIKAIYKNIADKTLSFGCKITVYDKIGEYTFINFNYKYGKIDVENCYTYDRGIIEDNGIDKIIGHPVMIGDVLDYCIGNKELNSIRLIGQNTIFGLLNRWKEKRKPLEMQNDDCIDFVFNLLPKE